MGRKEETKLLQQCGLTRELVEEQWNGGVWGSKHCLGCA